MLGVAHKTVTNGLCSIYLKRACEAAQVRRFTPHGLRRHAVDSLIRAGIDVGTAARLLGHSPEVMLRAYRQPTMTDMRDALSRTGLGTLPEGKVLVFPGS